MGKKDHDERETWGRKLDFMLSCVGYAVGLGNIWRFPYLCYRNGGGAFLVPYAIMLLICGFPIFFFELSLGQFASEGPVSVWKVNPLFYGIGWGMVSISAMVCVYYNVIIMYSIYYMFVSFVNLDGEVPWIDCDNPWNTKQCRQEAYPSFGTMTNDTEKIYELSKMRNATCIADKLPSVLANNTLPATATIYDLGFQVYNESFLNCDWKLMLPSEEYWTRFVLRFHESDGISDLGGVSLKNVLCLLLAWILVFFCLMKGIKSSGKVVYFTATFPYVLLVVLLVRGVTLPGYYKGIEFYIFPKWEQLKEVKVWKDAATQIFYSLGPAFGSLITMSSYNKFKNNCFRDSVIVAFINCSTSVFGGFAIFSLLGFMAHTTNQPVESVVDDGPGLAFIAYPEGIARLPVSSLWAFLFFFMILTLGLDSQFAMMEAVIGGATDVWPHILRPKKALFTFVCCMIGFALGIPQACFGGITVLTLFDWYCASYGLLLVAFAELVAVNWVYGIRNFMKDVEMMLGHMPVIFWVYYASTWVVITPCAIIFIIVMTGVSYTPAGYDGEDFPGWAEGLGWMMVAVPIVLILVGMIVQLVRNGGSLKKATTPHRSWGPRLAEYRVDRYNDNLGFVPDGDLENKVYHVNVPIVYPESEKL